MENPKTSVHRVEGQRVKRGLTQTEIGKAPGLTHKSISTIGSGRHAIPLENLILLTKCSAVSADYLLGLKDESSFKPIPLCETSRRRSKK